MIDEDGVDVVEAIDAWIDEEIDDLTDDELEVILEILDAVSASSLANVDADNIYDEDIDELVELAGGSAQDRAYTDAVLRAALFGDSFDAALVDPLLLTAVVDDDASDLDTNTDDEAEDEDEDADADEREDAKANDADAEGDHAEADTESEDEDPDDEQEETDDDNNESDDTDVEDDDSDVHASFLSDLADAENHDQQPSLAETAAHEDFLADLESTQQIESSPGHAPSVPPVVFRDFDELGPAFLSESSDSSRTSRRRNRRVSDILLPAFMIVGLAAFAFGMVQLIDSLNEEDAATEVASGPEEATPTEAPEPTAAPTEVPVEPTPADPSAPAPTPTPEPTPDARIGIRLVTGDVMVASFPEPEGIPELTQLYDVSEDDLVPALQVVWLAESLGIVDTDGNVLTVDPDARRPEVTTIYEAGGGLGEAIKIASVNDLIAILTEDGNISLTPNNGRADPDVIQVVWDAAEEGAKATDLSAVNGIVPFVLDNGNAQMILTDSNNAIIPIWVADDQPPAFNVGGSPTGILLGVGQGAVARYNLDAETDAILESVWDPFAREDEPAIGYSSAGAGTAIVTGNGAIVLADESGGGPLLWDPELTEIRAFVALGTQTQVVVLLETGSVVRIPLNPDELIESIWDITDETLSPANQVIVEPA